VKDIFFMDVAYRQAMKAFDHNEVPIGAILVDAHGKIVAQAYNQMEKKSSQLAHAEMQVLAKSAKKMNNWRLSGTTMYVTVQPCLMCLGALYLSRVSRVVYGIESQKFGVTLNLKDVHLDLSQSGIYKNLNMIIECLNYEKSKELLQLFFKKKRSPLL
jgi:tRNA(adenine34) deaminase